MDRFMTPQELAPELHRNPRTIVRMIRRGDIAHYITNGKEGNGIRYWVNVTREYGKGDGDERSR